MKKRLERHYGAFYVSILKFFHNFYCVYTNKLKRYSQSIAYSVKLR